MAAFRSLLSMSFKNINICKSGKTVDAFTKNFHVNTSVPNAAYDPDGKTVTSILNNEEGAPLMINGYSMLGFRLNNGLFVVGPVALFPRTILSWDVKDDFDVTEKSLSLFLHLAPKLDVLVVGLSDSGNKKLLLDTRKNVHQMTKGLRGNKMNIEVLPTEKAVSTFNFLNTENRFVAAALIPPINYSATLDDEYRVQYLTRKKKEGDYFLGD